MLSQDRILSQLWGPCSVLTGHCVEGVLFDLDGTLVDTVIDLTEAMNHVLALHGRPSYHPASIAATITQGTSGMICAAFGIDASDPYYPRYKQELIQAYHIQLETTSHSIQDHLFPGIRLILNYLQQHRIPWGIVTSKPFWLAQHVIRNMRLDYPPQCLIGYETLPYQKPHPLPLVYASQCIGIPPASIVYIGDALSDTVAANAAKMYSVTAAYGYLTPSDKPEQWGSDYIAYFPEDFLTWLQSYKE